MKHISDVLPGALEHIHGIYPPALEKQELKPFLWSAHKRCSEITWVLVLGLSPVIVVGVIALLVWWLA